MTQYEKGFEEGYAVAKRLYQPKLDSPKEAIKWAENEIKEYQNFIKLIKQNEKSKTASRRKA